MMEPRGFVDLQVNGYLGVDFASPDLEIEEIRRMTRILANRGTAAYCPTIITSSMEIYRRNLPILARAMEDRELRKRLIGIHLEGPYLSPEDGARGAHSLEFLRTPDPGEFDRFQEWAGGAIRILTLAPELEGAIELITHVRRRHPTVVSLGHHMALKGTLDRAVDAGATMVTHLGNGCPGLIHRHRNVLVDQLAEDRLTAAIITDGHHLPPEFIKVTLRCKGADRILVVSDIAPIAGYPPGIYETLGNQVQLTEDGRIQNLHNPYLVGSACDIAQCMRYLRSLRALSDKDLWKVGRDNPLRVLGLPPEAIDESDLSRFEW